MMILSLVRNYIPAHEQIRAGEWDVAAIARESYDLEGKTVGTVGAGRIGYRVLQRLMGFDCKLLWFDYADLPPGKMSRPNARLTVDAAKKINATRVAKLEDMLAQCDVVTVVSGSFIADHYLAQPQNCPLHEGTKGLFNKELISKMKKGAILVNTARGAICDRTAVKEALESGQLRGYAGDVWGEDTTTPNCADRRCPASAERPPVASDANPSGLRERHDPALLRHDPRCAKALR